MSHMSQEWEESQRQSNLTLNTRKYSSFITILADVSLQADYDGLSIKTWTVCLWNKWIMGFLDYFWTLHGCATDNRERDINSYMK